MVNEPSVFELLRFDCISMEVCSAFGDAKQKGIFEHKDIEGSDQTAHAQFDQDLSCLSTEYCRVNRDFFFHYENMPIQIY